MNALKHYTKMLICSAGLLGAALLAGCGSGDQGRDPILGVQAATLANISVTPGTATIAIGAPQQLTATAVYSDGSARDITATAAWTSASATVASVNPSGVATGVSAGNAIMTAAFDGKSAGATLTVLPAKLIGIVLQPATSTLNIGATLQYAVIGSFDNNTTRDVTAASVFSATTPAMATINAAGLATGKAQGTTGMTATSGGLSASASLTVLPANLVSLVLTPATTLFQIGATRPLRVDATYSDGTIIDVTANSVFVSANPAFVSVNATGVITGVAAGTSTLTATAGGKSATAQATTLAATVSSIAVAPAAATIAVGAHQQFIATATYSDGTIAPITTSAAWISSNTGVATVLSTGVATGLSTGTTTITASAGGQSGSGILTVTALPVGTTPVPVNLGSASNFAVLAGTSLTNNAGGTTLITGDVGSPSQTTAPTVAPGYTDYQSGAILDNALADLQVAIADANSRSCDVSFAGDINLGGQTMPPGVYCYTGAISITGTLTLNGPGVYIFRTALTLNTTANSVVALINGATGANVSWVPVGPSTLGANGAFIGSILGQSAAITVGDNTTLLSGRVLSGAAVTLSNNQIAK